MFSHFFVVPQKVLWRPLRPFSLRPNLDGKGYNFFSEGTWVDLSLFWLCFQHLCFADWTFYKFFIIRGFRDLKKVRFRGCWSIVRWAFWSMWNNFYIDWSVSGSGIFFTQNWQLFVFENYILQYVIWTEMNKLIKDTLNQSLLLKITSGFKKGTLTWDRLIKS